MQHTEALKRLRNLFRRDESAFADALSGPTLVEQEPDLVNEVARHSVAASGWTAGGHPSE